jgi:acyl-coenzyme A synthetase/AMP-(fatty) acid ligase
LELQDRAERLRCLINQHSWQRVALRTERADTVIVALAASQGCSCDVLLLRDDYSADDPVWSAWQAEALLDDEFAVRRAFPGSKAEGSGCVLLTTSGTTGRPKVAAHSIEVLASRVTKEKLRTDTARWLLTFHPASYAGLQVILTILFTRAELIAFVRPNVSDLLKAAQTEQPTHVSATPTFWRSLLIASSHLDAKMEFRQITIGGEAVDQSTLDQLSRTFSTARITHIYASTEAGALFSVSDKRAGFPAAWMDIGVEGVKLRIREGILEILSPRAMKGYVGELSSKNQADDGWLISGDLVEIVGDRVLFRGRIDNIINVGGAKVMPEEVEAVLLQHEAVREAMVFGQRNPLVGAIVCADIVLSPGFDGEEVRTSIYSHASQRLEAHKLPRVLRFVTAIGTNAAGKKVRLI